VGARNALFLFLEIASLLRIHHAVGPAVLAVVLLVAARTLAIFDDAGALALTTLELLGLLDYSLIGRMGKKRMPRFYTQTPFII